MKTQKQLLPVATIRKELGLTRSEIHALIEAGRLPVIKLGSDQKRHFRAVWSDVLKLKYELAKSAA